VDEQSMWKKEISFRRKPKAQQTPPEPGSEPSSIWKKEVSFKRTRKPVAQASPAVTAPADNPAAKQSIWKKEISLGRKKTADARPVAPKPVVAPTAPPVVEPERVVEPVAAALAPVGPDPEQVAPPPAAVAPEPEPEPVPVEVEPVADAPVVDEPIDVAPPERWAAEPELPPEPIDVEPAAASVGKAPTIEAPVAVPEPEPTPAPAREPVGVEPVVVHPPVPAAELRPVEASDKRMPLWKREIVVGRRRSAQSKPKPERPKRRDKKAEKAKKAVKPKRERMPKQKRAKAPKVKVDRGGAGKKLVGLKIGASQLAAARVVNNGSVELLQLARDPLSPGVVVGGELRDPDALAVALKDFFTKHKLPKRGVRLGISNNRIGVRTFDVVGVDDVKQLDNAIRFRAQEALPIPIDEAVLDYQTLSETRDDDGQLVRKILLVVAYREQIDRYVDACKKAGIGLVGIDLEAFALLRALQAPHSTADAALVAVAIGHERSTFAVSDGRVCEFTRVLEWGGSAVNIAIARTLDAAPSEVEGIKRALSLEDSIVPDGLTDDQAAKARDAVQRAVQAFARELVSSLQFYQNQPGSLGIGEIALTGGTAHLPGLSAELERLIGVHVRVGDPLARIKVSKRVGEPEQVGSYAVAIGLGIED
jgi:type IV pilus assembly protein PilM